MSGCPRTCVNLQADPRDCPRNPSEGCECDEGFVMDGTNCVSENACGCQLNMTDENGFNIVRYMQVSG